jgi:ABC-type spermidine/putrescine transport system permease subunit II
VRKRPIGARRALSLWAFVVYAFLYIPIILVVVYAFNKNRDVGLWTGFTTHWFGDALGDSQYVSALETSLKIAAISSFFATLLGTGAALALARMRKAARAPFDVLVYLTLVVPEIVIAVASLIFFVQAHQRIGWLIPGPGWIAIMLAHMVFSISLVTLIVRARFVGMGSTLEEASFDLGAAPLQTFRQVTLPRLLPAILAGYLLSFTFSFDDYVLSQFTAGGSTETWPILVFSAVRFGVTPKLNAFATVMLAVTLIVLALAGLVLRRSRGSGGAADGDAIASQLGLG